MGFWVSMGIYGYHGCLWVYMSLWVLWVFLSERIWVSVGTYRFLWVSGCLRVSMGIPRFLWVSMGVMGIYVFLGGYGYLWVPIGF